MQKKRILFLIPTLGGGGAERVLVNLVNGMDKSKYDITVQTLFKAGVNSVFLNEDVRFIEGRIKQFPGNILLMKLFKPTTLFNFFIKEKYDVLVSYLEGASARILFGCKDKSVGKLSWIHVVHKNEADTFYSFRSKEEATKCYESFDRMIYVSRDVMSDFTSYYPSLKKNIVIYNTNNDDMIKRMAAEPIDDISLSDEINIVSVGRLIPMKGFDRLIEAHHRLKQEGLKNHVYILGTGDLKEELEFQICKNGDSDTVHLLGFRSNPYSIVSRCDVYACSSHREGFSTAVTEALILGVPVVTTRVSGAIEQMGKNNEYGIVTESTVEGLYDGLKQMLQNVGCLEKYRKQAQKRGSYFSKENAIRSVEKLIEEL